MHTVQLQFFEDDATGEWGLSHTNSIENGFNAFWNGIGIFHDVFEHWFEDKHKYFRNDYAFNVAGEVAAMGACWYYTVVLGSYERRIEHRIGWEQVMLLTTFDLIQESVDYDYKSFGDTFDTAIKRIKSPGYYGFSHLLDEYRHLLSKLSNKKDSKEFDEEYFKSVTVSKIRKLKSWGVSMAEKLVPNNYENRNILNNFCNLWKSFCLAYPAEEVAQYFDSIKFNISKKKGIVQWNAYLMPKDYFAKSVRLNEKNILNFNLDSYVYDTYKW